MIDGKGKFLPESKRGLPTPWVAFYKIFGLWYTPKVEGFWKIYHLSYLNENKLHKIDVLAGAFMLMRKEALDKVGLSTKIIMYGEDLDLWYRITKGGYKNYYFPAQPSFITKAESTKKETWLHADVYNAMIILPESISQNKMRALFFFINLAIYFRAALATISR